MLRWFRHYAGLSRDEKLCAVATAAKQPIERVVWLWGVMLEDAAERNDGGTFAIDLPGAAWFLHCDQADLEAIMAGLARTGRIDAGRILNWPARQFVSDTSTSRVRKHRAAKRNADVTFQ